MKRKLVIAVVLALAGIAVACVLYAGMFADPFQRRLSAKTMRVLEKGERFVLYSLDPARPKTNSPPRDTFHDYTILGRIEIPNEQGRAELLLDALYKGIEESDGSVAKCFEPRHGISATLDGKTVDLVICFECMQIAIWEKESVKIVPTSRFAMRAFNEVLMQGEVPLAEQ